MTRLPAGIIGRQLTVWGGSVALAAPAIPVGGPALPGVGLTLKTGLRGLRR